MKDDTNHSDPSSADRGVHIYDDDIVEEDNQLPTWWLYTLFGTIAFAFLYWYGEQQLRAWQPREVAYQEEMVAIRMEQAKNSGGALSRDALVAMSKSPTSVGEGQQIFATTCSPCHGPNGGGNIGPNLTDDFWLHGSEPESIWKDVHEGVPAKGMPAWGPQLGDKKVASVAAYVLTIQGSNVAGGKAPQGEKAK